MELEKPTRVLVPGVGKIRLILRKEIREAQEKDQLKYLRSRRCWYGETFPMVFIPKPDTHWHWLNNPQCKFARLAALHRLGTEPPAIWGKRRFAQYHANCEYVVRWLRKVEKDRGLWHVYWESFDYAHDRRAWCVSCLKAWVKRYTPQVIVPDRVLCEFEAREEGWVVRPEKEGQ